MRISVNFSSEFFVSVVAPSKNNCSRESKVPEYSSQTSTSSLDPGCLLDFASPAPVPSTSCNKAWNQKGRHVSGCGSENDQQSWSNEFDNLQPSFNGHFSVDGNEFCGRAANDPISSRSNRTMNQFQQFTMPANGQQKTHTKQEEDSLKWDETPGFGFPTATENLNAANDAKVDRFSMSLPNEDSWRVARSFSSPVVDGGSVPEREGAQYCHCMSSPASLKQHQHNSDQLTGYERTLFRNVSERLMFRQNSISIERPFQYHDEKSWYPRKSSSPYSSFDSNNRWTKMQNTDGRYDQVEPPPLAHYPSSGTYQTSSVPDFRSCHLTDVRPGVERTTSNPGFKQSQISDQHRNRVFASHHSYEENQIPGRLPLQNLPISCGDSNSFATNDNAMDIRFRHPSNPVASNFSRHISSEGINKFSFYSRFMF